MKVIEIIKQMGDTIGPADIIICLPGLTLLGIWLLRTSLGRNALTDAPPRRNNMAAYLPLVPLFIWLVITSAAMLFKELRLPNLPDWQNAYLDNLILSIGSIIGTGVIILLARRHFARRLKGFGLNLKTMPRDFFAALANLISIYPLVFGALILTILVGKLISGPGFEMQKHQELEMIEAYSQMQVKIMVVLTAVVVVPVFEEMLFRGLFQTTMRSYLTGFAPLQGLRKNGFMPWLSIVLSSLLFAAVHANAGHWPALFVLAVCMGYAYEKSGSLLRPIFIHSFFNAVNITAALYAT
ncbi:MAG: lysostaphin resistance A-like protein [Planctomycetota bacterium]|jgi:membrane protease YdiL (CAAX protease family)